MKQHNPNRARMFTLLLLLALPGGPSCGETLTLPPDQRPAWLHEEGLVMAGDWEALPMRARIYSGSVDFTPSDAERRAYQYEHSPEMIAALREMGVNFVMIHGYRGAGVRFEHDSMLDAARFARRYHDAGMHVGTYNYSGTIFWEKFLDEVPGAVDWVVLDAQGQRATYGGQPFRYVWCRNHPAAQAYYREIVRFGIEKVHADLLHWDNYTYGMPGRDAYSVEQFRRYLARTFSPEELRAMGAADLSKVQPAMTGLPDNLLRRAWLDFSAQSLADSYHDMSRFARSLDPNVLIESNPQTVGWRMPATIDHGRLLSAGEAFWHEGTRPGMDKDLIISRFRDYKIGCRMGNMNFNYTTNPLEAAESMAFNLDCLGCVCWYEWGKLSAAPGSTRPFSRELLPYIRFYRARRDIYSRADVVADVAVLRSYPSQVFTDPSVAALTARVEQLLFEHPTAFQIIYDQHLRELDRYCALVLAGCPALSDEAVAAIEAYVKRGGHVCMIGPAATHDRWMRPRPSPALENLPADRVVHCASDGDLLGAINRACPERSLNLVSASVDDQPFNMRDASAHLGLGCELTQKPYRRYLHLVNYRDHAAITSVGVQLRVPAGDTVKEVRLSSPERVEELTLPMQRTGENVSFVVPRVNVYEIATVVLGGATPTAAP